MYSCLSKTRGIIFKIIRTNLKFCIHRAFNLYLRSRSVRSPFTTAYPIPWSVCSLIIHSAVWVRPPFVQSVLTVLLLWKWTIVMLISLSLSIILKYISVLSFLGIDLHFVNIKYVCCLVQDSSIATTHRLSKST